MSARGFGKHGGNAPNLRSSAAAPAAARSAILKYEMSPKLADLLNLAKDARGNGRAQPELAALLNQGLAPRVDRHRAKIQSGNYQVASVTTKYGVVNGVAGATVNQYLGIPYTAPPVVSNCRSPCTVSADLNPATVISAWVCAG